MRKGVVRLVGEFFLWSALAYAVSKATLWVFGFGTLEEKYLIYTALGVGILVALKDVRNLLE